MKHVSLSMTDLFFNSCLSSLLIFLMWTIARLQAFMPQEEPRKRSPSMQYRRWRFDSLVPGKRKSRKEGLESS